MSYEAEIALQRADDLAFERALAEHARTCDEIVPLCSACSMHFGLAPGGDR